MALVYRTTQLGGLTPQNPHRATAVTYRQLPVRTGNFQYACGTFPEESLKGHV